MNGQKNKWSTFDVIKSKPIIPFVISLVITIIIKKAIYIYGLNPDLSFSDQTLFLSIGNSPVLYVLVIPLFFIVSFLFKGHYSKKYPKQEIKEEVNMVVDNTAFKWKGIYSLLIGYVIYFIGGGCITLIERSISDKLWPENAEDITSSALKADIAVNLCAFAAIIVLIIIDIKIVKAIHKAMMKKTQTNAYLIAGLLTGYYTDELYPQYRNEDDLYNIIKILETGTVSSIKGACRMYSICSSLKKHGKRFGIGMLIFTVITCGLGIMAGDAFMKEFHDDIKGRMTWREYYDLKYKEMEDNIVNRLKNERRGFF